jgi:hypothetical protein
MKLLILESSPASLFSSAPCSQTPSIYILPFMREMVLYPYKATGKIIVPYILI